MRVPVINHELCNGCLAIVFNFARLGSWQLYMGADLLKALLCFVICYAANKQQK